MPVTGGLPPLRDVIAAHGLGARKSLGQNFLLDLNLTAKIARMAGDLKECDVLEVGPGPGGLTRGLLAQGARRVLAVEKDPRCLPALQEIAEAWPGRLDIVNGDALSIDMLARLTPPIRIVANLPYNTIQNNVFNRIERDILRQPWERGPRAVAVAVDGLWHQVGIKEDGTGYIREYTAPSAEELATIKELLKPSTLFNEARGDRIEVRHVQKDRSEQFRLEDEELQRQMMIRRLLIVSSISLAVFILIYLLYRAIKKEIARRRRLREEELAAQQQLMREAALRVADEGAAEVELSVDEKARREMLENAINLAREKPDQVAKLLRTWLAEE